MNLIPGTELTCFSLDIMEILSGPPFWDDAELPHEGLAEVFFDENRKEDAVVSITSIVKRLRLLYMGVYG